MLGSCAIFIPAAIAAAKAGLPPDKTKGAADKANLPTLDLDKGLTIVLPINFTPGAFPITLPIFFKNPPNPACTTGRLTIPPEAAYLIASLGSITLSTKPPKAMFAYCWSAILCIVIDCKFLRLSMPVISGC